MNGTTVIRNELYVNVADQNNLHDYGTINQKKKSEQQENYKPTMYQAVYCIGTKPDRNRT
jgi:hypothetical protein